MDFDIISVNDVKTLIEFYIMRAVMVILPALI